MRFAGFYSQGGEARPDLEDSLTGSYGMAKGTQFRRLSGRQGNSQLLCLVSDGVKPRVSWATRPDGSFAVVDGELYNASDLFQVETDAAPDHAEAVLEIYLSKGEAGLAEIDAAAFSAIWDAQRERLLLVRDPWGKAPGFYSELAKEMVWASDLGTVLRAGVDGQVNLNALDSLMSTGFVPAPWTFAERVKKIPPGHLVCVENGGSVSVRRYWRPRAQPKLTLDPAAVNEGLRESFEKALRRHWSAGTGVLLSGGVDSKAILAGAHKFLGVSPDTFTFQYADYEGPHNEATEARRAAEHFGCKHHALIFRPSDIEEKLEWFVQSYGQPFTTGLHTCMLGDAVEAGASVLLSGPGPDGWFLAQRDYYGLRFSHLPAPAKKLAKASLPLLNLFNRDLAETWGDVIWCGETRYPYRCHEMITRQGTRSTLYSNSAWVEQGVCEKVALLEHAAETYAGESESDRLKILKRQFHNAEGLFYWNHHWGRAHGLMIRFPFMSDINDFALQLEFSGRNKDEMRRFAATLMPQDLAYTGKYPQSLPIGQWLRGPLKELLCDLLTSTRVKNSGLFNPAGVQGLVDRHLKGGGKHGMTLWAIMTTLIWMDLVARKEL